MTDDAAAIAELAEVVAAPARHARAEPRAAVLDALPELVGADQIRRRRPHRRRNEHVAADRTGPRLAQIVRTKTEHGPVAARNTRRAIARGHRAYGAETHRLDRRQHIDHRVVAALAFEVVAPAAQRIV